MGRSGMQSTAGVLIVLSLAMLFLFNQHIAAFDWTTSSSSSSLSIAAGSKSYSMEGLHRSNMVVGEERKRKLLQIATTAAAPAPAAAGSGAFISYDVLRASYVCCPPQTGRSYYTSNCQSASGPVQPYVRDCNTMTKCARG